MQSRPKEKKNNKRVHYLCTFCAYAILCKKLVIEQICLSMPCRDIIGELLTVLCKILVMLCREQQKRKSIQNKAQPVLVSYFGSKPTTPKTLVL